MRISFKQLYWATKEATQRFSNTFSVIWQQINVLAVFYFYVYFFPFRKKINQKERHILFISYYSSPYKSFYGTQRLGKFIKYLDRMGWRVTLLTSVPVSAKEIDPGAEPFPDTVEVVRIKSIKAQSLLGKKQLIPDDFIPWVLPSVRQIRDIISKNNISILCTTAPPYSNLLAGTIASKRYGIPHITDFRDPWSRIDWTGWTLASPLARMITRQLEKQVLRQADMIVMTDEIKYVQDYFADTSPTIINKITSVLNGYDEEDIIPYQSGCEKPYQKFVISYVGTFYGQESFENLIVPLTIWQKDFPDDFRNVLFEYAGPGSARFDKSDFRPPYLIDHGYVTHKEAISIRSRSTLQLFTQPVRFKLHVLSGKIFEMIAMNIPILAITKPNSAASNLITRTRTGFVAPYDDHAGTAKLLKQLYEQWRIGELIVTPDTELVRSLSRENQTQRFATILESMLA